ALHLELARTANSDDARAFHLGEAATGPDETAAAALERAAASARERGASLDAISLYERASSLTPRAGLATGGATRAAEGAFLDLADLHSADAILARAVGHAEPGAARAEALSLRALVWYFEGRLVEATSLCEDALHQSAGDRVVRVSILLRCAYLHGQLDMSRSMREITEAGEILEREGGTVDAELM